MQSGMKIIVVGKGGREHALIQALQDSPSKPELYAWPGSEGMGDQITRVDVAGLEELIAYVDSENIDLVVAGEEAWLAKGLGDRCKTAGVPCWGPLQEPAQLESSKIYAKQFMTRHSIPTGDFHVVSTLAEAKDKIDGYPTVLKYNGLAAGKGVAVCFEEAQADEFLDTVFTQKKFGDDDVFIEEFLAGKEVSVICAVADREFVVFTPARDYKRLKDNDEGPNTGGMGAVASRNLLDAETMMDIENDIIGPTVNGLADDGIEYRGFLYFGIILTATGPKILEYNCRFGDPEAQAVLPIVGGEFAGFLQGGAQGALDSSILEFDDGWSICLVKASRDYPYSSGSGDIISGLESVQNGRVYHAGTKRNAEGQYETNGGRVLAVAAKGKTRNEAVENVYREAEHVQFDGAVIRTDIGKMHFED